MLVKMLMFTKLIMHQFLNKIIINNYMLHLIGNTYNNNIILKLIFSDFYLQNI